MSETKYEALYNLNRGLLNRIDYNRAKGKFEPDEGDKKAWEIYNAKLQEIEKEELIDSLKDLSISFDGNGLRSKKGDDLLLIKCGKISIDINFFSSAVNINGVTLYIEKIPIYIKSVEINYIDDGILIDINPVIGSRRKYKISNDNIYKSVYLLSDWAFKRRVYLSKEKVEVYLPKFLPDGFLEEIK